MSNTIIETLVKPTRVVEYYPSTNGVGWHWRVRNIKNNKIVLTGAEGYSKKGNVLRAINKETSNWFPGSFTGPNEVIA
jgi:uncharacterized protein YegP (UPF0339 family)